MWLSLKMARVPFPFFFVFFRIIWFCFFLFISWLASSGQPLTHQHCCQHFSNVMAYHHSTRPYTYKHTQTSAYIYIYMLGYLWLTFKSHRKPDDEKSERMTYEANGWMNIHMNEMDRVFDKGAAIYFLLQNNHGNVLFSHWKHFWYIYYYAYRSSLARVWNLRFVFALYFGSVLWKPM